MFFRYITKMLFQHARDIFYNRNFMLNFILSSKIQIKMKVTYLLYACWDLTDTYAHKVKEKVKSKKDLRAKIKTDLDPHKIVTVPQHWF